MKSNRRPQAQKPRNVTGRNATRKTQPRKPKRPSWDDE